MDTIDEKSQSGMSRRDMLRILGGVTAANGLGAAMWGASAQDVWKLKIASGDTVEITSRYGALRGKARVTSSPREGVVFATFHFDGRVHLHRAAAVCAGDVGLCAKGLPRFAEPQGALKLSI